jgi:hypothetical protein
MADPDRMASGQEVWLSLEFGFQIAQLADGALDEDALFAQDGQAGRVVAAIFQAPQAIDDDRSGWPRAEVTDDPTHVTLYLAYLNK